MSEISPSPTRLTKHIVYLHRQTAALLGELVAERRKQGRRPLECTRDSVIWDALKGFGDNNDD